MLVISILSHVMTMCGEIPSTKSNKGGTNRQKPLYFYFCTSVPYSRGAWLGMRNRSSQAMIASWSLIRNNPKFAPQSHFHFRLSRLLHSAPIITQHDLYLEHQATIVYSGSSIVPVFTDNRRHRRYELDMVPELPEGFRLFLQTQLELERKRLSA
jgi:hypothetical protein